MFLPDEQLKKILLSSKMIDQATWDDAYANALRLNVPVEDILKERDIIAGHILYELVAKAIKMPYINLKTHDIPPRVMDLLDYRTASVLHAVPFEAQKGKPVKVACLDPLNKRTLKLIKSKLKRPLEIFLTGKEGFAFATRHYQKNVAEKIKKEVQRLATSKGKNTERISTLLVEYLYYTHPSDIHLEHLDDGGVIKFRIDGFLYDEFFVPDKVLDELIRLLCVNAHISHDAKNSADGRLAAHVFGEFIAFRVSLVPAYHGRTLVLRVINESSQKMSLRDHGLEETSIELVKKEIKKPYGLILVSGPTGSGKSSTLYSLVKMLNLQGVSIATIEDPIEYSIRHVNQTQVDLESGYTFVQGLRHLLRQDPNVIMVGEIRDNETAGITAEAALTGHIVLSTIHANTAVGTITRLRNMEVKPYLIGPTLNLAISQRLVKRICPYCREGYEVMKSLLDSMDGDTHVYTSFEKLRTVGLLSTNDYSALRFYRGKGCLKCAGSGYRGRVGLYEILKVDDEIQKMILEEKDEQTIQKEAEKKGMLTLFEDGLIKVISGETTIEEVMRVIN
ncbi:MAG: GspE/PulE family protein [bacterium]|nr:GspE/PulE family protein [bacterium]